MPLAALCPQPLVRLPEAFNDRSWLWELKRDGFRVLAYLEDGGSRLVSRHGHTFRSFDALRAGLTTELRVKDAILDGEIVCLEAEGRPLFNRLLFRRQTPVYAAFDVLWVTRLRRTAFARRLACQP